MTHSLTVHSLVDALAESLRERILTELSPDTVVGETEVARHYNVARPTAKAAIERLVSEGLLHRDAHRSARVPVLNAADVRDLYFARSCLESEVMRRLTAAGAPPVAAQEQNDRLRQAISGDDLTALVEPDIAFHRILTDALGSPRLSRAHAAIMGEMRLCMTQVQAQHLLDPEIIVAEHAAIFDAVGAGDPSRAAAELQAHLDRACRVLVAHLERED